MKLKNLLKFLKLFILNEEFRKDFLNKELRDDFLNKELRTLIKSRVAEELKKESLVKYYLDVLDHYEIPEDVHISVTCQNRMKKYEAEN